MVNSLLAFHSRVLSSTTSSSTYWQLSFSAAKDAFSWSRKYASVSEAVLSKQRGQALSGKLMRPRARKLPQRTAGALRV